MVARERRLHANQHGLHVERPLGQRCSARKKALGEKQMHHEQIMIVAFAAVFLALVTGFALMLG